MDCEYCLVTGTIITNTWRYVNSRRRHTHTTNRHTSFNATGLTRELAHANCTSSRHKRTHNTGTTVASSSTGITRVNERPSFQQTTRDLTQPATLAVNLRRRFMFPYTHKHAQLLQHNFTRHCIVHNRKSFPSQTDFCHDGPFALDDTTVYLFSYKQLYFTFWKTTKLPHFGSGDHR